MALKVLIVEDMVTYRTIIARSLGEISGVEVVGKASNGKKALEFLENNQVDLITLDVEMPVLDGLSTLKEIKRKRIKVEVVMLSGLSDQAAQLTIQCLELGAVDFVLKPQSTSYVQNQEALIEHLKIIVANLKRKPGYIKRAFQIKTATPRAAPKPSPQKPVRKRSLGFSRPKLLLIGISTGGPRALATVFENLQGPLSFPILIVQHMPPKFTKSLADSLTKKGTVPVVEATDGDVLQANRAYIAPGGCHMFMEKEEDFGMILATNQEPPVNSCRPSVDVLFKSVIPYYKSGEVVALIMTGMGRDGADGAVALSKAGGYVVIQSEDSCTIYGMPKSVEDLNIQNEILHLDEIAPFISKIGKRR